MAKPNAKSVVKWLRLHGEKDRADAVDALRERLGWYEQLPDQLEQEAQEWADDGYTESARITSEAAEVLRQAYKNRAALAGNTQKSRSIK